MNKWLLIVALCTSTVALASPSHKLDTIKHMYQVDKKAQQGNQTLILFTDRSLQRLFEQMPAEEVCLDHDVMWQSQDPDYRKKLRFSTAKDGRVNVKLGSSASVSYSLNCIGSQCKITDAFDDGKVSIKKTIIENCSP